MFLLVEGLKRGPLEVLAQDLGAGLVQVLVLEPEGEII